MRPFTKPLWPLVLRTFEYQEESRSSAGVDGVIRCGDVDRDAVRGRRIQRSDA